MRCSSTSRARGRARAAPRGSSGLATIPVAAASSPRRPAAPAADTPRKAAARRVSAILAPRGPTTRTGNPHSRQRTAHGASVVTTSRASLRASSRRLRRCNRGRHTAHLEGRLALETRSDGRCAGPVPPARAWRCVARSRDAPDARSIPSERSARRDATAILRPDQRDRILETGSMCGEACK
jgi:hypothetical protein